MFLVIGKNQRATGTTRTAQAKRRYRLQQVVPEVSGIVPEFDRT
jgi:hypothetical protein